MYIEPRNRKGGLTCSMVVKSSMIRHPENEKNVHEGGSVGK